MIKIGLKNFGQFRSLNGLELSKINYFVGPNNSGKSTLSKALILFFSYLNPFNNSHTPYKFYLDRYNTKTSSLNYGLLKNIFAEDDFISFDFEIGHYKVSTKITAPSDTRTTLDVIKYSVEDLKNQILYSYSDSLVRIRKKSTLMSEVVGDILSKGMKEELSKMNKLLKSNPDRKDKAHFELIDARNRLRSRIEELSQKETAKEYELSVLFDLFYEPLNKASLHSLINDFVESYEKIYFDYRENHKDLEIDTYQEDDDYENVARESAKNSIDDFSPLYLTAFYECRNEIKSNNLVMTGIEYTFRHIQSFLPKHSVIYTLNDSENSLSSAIHTFYQNYLNDVLIVKFVNKWLKIFGIGDELEIRSIDGAAYLCNVIQENSKISLGRKGSGTIQLVNLILNVINYIPSKSQHGINMIILEEPEINLHPAFQSKITDFLYDCHMSFDLHFIIETHSEYMIRRSQIVAIENDHLGELGDNPFSVTYFTGKDEGPFYQLNYTTDGTFDQDFGTGFLDEASAMTLKILRHKRNMRRDD